MKLIIKKQLLLTAIMILAIDYLSAQDKYFKVKIDIQSCAINELSQLGIETDHGIHKHNYYLINWLSTHELHKLDVAHISYEILMDHTQHHNPKFGTAKNNYIEDCFAINYTNPTNYNGGSMGGFLTYAEMMTELNDMAAAYPNLITVPTAVASNTTIEGDTIWYVKLSDNAAVKEPENEILYTALHHAREPMGMQNLIFYMWYLIENYNSDSLVKYIVDNTELYFIPCINVDGYKYNELTNPQGGGYWRKNRRDNLDGTFGVDLNRNYGFNWAFDDNGSSPFTGDNTYRGTTPFSEPETQMVRDFCSAHNFHVALNYHSFGDLLIYPWGYIPNLYTPDSAIFVDFASQITLHNSYKPGTPNQTVNYTVNGSSDDWMYGEQGTKNKIFAFTPETGYDFWPSIFDIEPIVKTNVFANLQAALIAGKYATVKDETDVMLTNSSGYFKYTLITTGVDTNATFTVIVSDGGTGNIVSTGPAKSYANLPKGAIIEDSISYVIAPAAQIGDIVDFSLSVSNGLYAWTDTLSKFISAPSFVLDDHCNNSAAWTTVGWGISNSQFVSPAGSITDSPFGNYSDNDYKSITTISTIPLPSTGIVELTFFTKFAIEPNFDYVILEITHNNGNSWQPLCGQYSRQGGPYQAAAPVYEGFQEEWVRERINLDAYKGKNIRLRFTLISDFGNTFDGFYFDDIRINGGVSLAMADYSTSASIAVYPIPTDNVLNINLPPNLEYVTICVYDAQGRVVINHAVNSKASVVPISVSHLPQGIYTVHVSTSNGHVYTTRAMVN